MNMRQVVFCRDGVLRIRQKHINPNVDFAIPLSEIESLSRTGILSAIGASHVEIEQDSSLLSVVSCLQPWSDILYEASKIDLNSWIEDFQHAKPLSENFLNIRLSKNIGILETDKIHISETWEIGVYHDNGDFMGDFIDFPPDILGLAKFQLPNRVMLNNTTQYQQLPIIDPAHPLIFSVNSFKTGIFSLNVERTEIGFSDFVINGLLGVGLRYTTPMDAFLISTNTKKWEQT